MDGDGTTFWGEIEANARAYPGSGPAMGAIVALAVLVAGLVVG